jgi:hypothetical protein
VKREAEGTSLAKATVGPQHVAVSKRGRYAAGGGGGGFGGLGGGGFGGLSAAWGNAFPVMAAPAAMTFIMCLRPRGPLEQLLAVSWRRHGQKGFHMDDDGDLHRQILHIEAHIEELADVIERCRKIILISKAAIAAGGALILAIIIGAVGFDPTVMIGAIAAVIGGIVVFGSNTITLKQTTTDMKAAEAQRAELINRMDLRVVDGEVER